MNHLNLTGRVRGAIARFGGMIRADQQFSW